MRGGFQRERTIFHDWREMDWHSGVLSGKPQKSRLLPGCCIFKKKKKKVSWFYCLNLQLLLNLHYTKSYQGLYPVISSSSTSILKMSGHFTFAFQPLLSLHTRENASHWLQLKFPQHLHRAQDIRLHAVHIFFLKTESTWTGVVLFSMQLGSAVIY